MSLQGVLSDFGAADVFQLIAQQRKTGVLEIEDDERALEVHFQEGQVVRARPSETRAGSVLAHFLLRTGSLTETDLAEARRVQQETLEPLIEILMRESFVQKEELESSARLLSDETIFELFLWNDGRFAFNPGDIAPEFGDAMIGAEMVLLDALRMRDEWDQIKKKLPDMTGVMGQSVEHQVYQERRAAIEQDTGLSGEELDRLFTRCDGRLSLRRVIDLSRLGTFRGARGVVSLLCEGVLHVAARSRRKPRIERASLSFDSWGRGAWLLGLTGAVAIGLFLIPAPRLATWPLPVEALSHARASSELERLRLVLESYRWRTGDYPESLGVLAEDQASASTPLPFDRYSYERSVGGYTLVEK